VTASVLDPAAPRSIILDCDPGIDDALAIAFACGHPGLELLGLTTVSGNVDLAKTTANALSVPGWARRGSRRPCPGRGTGTPWTS
jgi:purine nucleosidase